MEKIKVGMAQMELGKAPDILITLGLGSCVGIVLYEPDLKVGGMAHIMLPDSTQIKRNSNRAKFADTAIQDLVESLLQQGITKERLVAKIAGGAEMFASTETTQMMRIGKRNVIAVKNNLEKFKIPIIAEDTGSNYGRTIEMDLSSGELKIRTVGHQLKII